MESIKELIKESSELVVLFLGYMGLEVVKRIKQYRSERKAEVNSDPKKLMQKKNEIENLCVIIGDQTKAQHVAVWRLHNGEFYSGGDSIKKLSMYTEWAITDSLHVDANSQELALKNFSKTYMELTENDFVSIQQGEASDWHMNKLMKDRGYSFMVCVLLHAPASSEYRKVPVGMLCISYLSENFDFKTINSPLVRKYKKELEYKIDNFLS